MGEARAKQEALTKAIQAGPQQLRVTPQQMATLLLLEGQSAQLQFAANQLGGALGLTAAADVLLSAKEHIDKSKVRMQHEWQNAIVIAQPSDVPKLAGEFD